MSDSVPVINPKEHLVTMKPLRLMGLTLIAACVMAGAASASASAALPEFLKTGPTLTGTSGASTLETKSGTKVTCTAGKNTGTITGVKTVSKIVVTFTGCKSSGFACKTPTAASGELITTELTGTLGYTNTAKKEVGVKLAPTAGGKFIEFECVGGIIKVQVTGSVIGALTPVNTLSTKSTLTFKQTKGVQALTKFEGEKEESFLKTSIGGGAAEQSGQESTSALVTSEADEVKA
ncbi:MAG TPA: hypothetical protein VLJ80_06120 [Solirubrobacteraceae bacterium]|nr:hypothetical protein [Solirubrobacteraceae bacterium]